jgi:hypothetical protein
LTSLNFDGELFGNSRPYIHRLPERNLSFHRGRCQRR